MSAAPQAAPAASPPSITLTDAQCARVAALLSLGRPAGGAS